MNLPVALIDSLEHLPGFNRASFEAVHTNGAQVNSIRLNPAKQSILDTPSDCIYQVCEGYWKMKTRPVPWNLNGWYLGERPSYTLDPLLHAGAYYVQEASSMFISFALKQLYKDRGDLKALDLCAAPGGKSTLLAAEPCFNLVLANEVIATRANILYENIVKWGEPHVFVSRNDPSVFSKLQGYFDCMLVDAPCSGSGLFRRDPEAAKEWSPNQVQFCSNRQQRILEDALPALKQDGVLIYSTCSYSKEENEDILDWLCETQDMISVSLSVPEEWGIVESVSTKAGAKGYRFYPDRIAGEGLFIACLKKQRAVNLMGWKSQALEKADRNTVAVVKDKLVSEPWLLTKKEENIFAIPAPLEEDIHILSGNLQLRKSGNLLGTVIRNELIPDHELAVSRILLGSVPTVKLDRENAIRFLKKEGIDPGEAPRGWALATFGGRGLGWMKVLPNRINNYYPAAWRITTSKTVENE